MVEVWLKVKTTNVDCIITFPFSISLATADGTGISLNVQTLTVFVECQIRISEDDGMFSHRHMLCVR